MMAIGGSVLDSLAWVACAVPFMRFFKQISVHLVAMAVVVITSCAR
jgi:hypothetical protein